ncbi:TetR/AcrR family transcriptional regulator [Protaetiibacter larvae]|nr:TetR/AcrR family transcriptional regulator [Protaetiibacter larvae]
MAVVDSDARSKFAVRREATRRELLRLGIERIRVHGFSATTVEDIVSGSDLTRGAFYFHFANKEEFFLELQRERARYRGEWWLIARDPEVTSLEAAFTRIFAYFEEVEPDGGAWVLPLADYELAIRSSPERHAGVAAFYRGWIDELTTFVQELAQKGLVRTDLPADAVATELFAAAEGFILHRYLYEAPPTGLIDALTRIAAP